MSLAGRRGLNFYEVNTWLWMFGRGKPCLDGLTIEETSDRQDSAGKASDKRRKETVMAARMMVPEVKCELDWYEYVLAQIIVCTFHPKYIPSTYFFFQSTYLVHTGMYCVYKNWQWMLVYVVCLWETIVMTYV